MDLLKSEYDDLSVEECLSKLNVDEKTGLSQEEASKRQQNYGPNILEEKKESLWEKFFKFFWGPIPWMIEIAVIISGLLERWPDFILILALLFLNAILGFFHEYQADNAISALKNKLALKSKVLRNGAWQDIEASQLTPGDIVSVKLGNIIPADIKLVSGQYLSIDQSALTGESLPVDKKSGDIAYSGTVVKLGEMIGVVTKIGMKTFFGQTAKLIQSAKTESHFQKTILNIGRFLIICTLSIAAIILIFSLINLEYNASFHTSLGDIAIFLLVLVVAGIPVALPAVTSVTMAVGAHRMAKLKAIVSKLIAIEELAGMNILCSDKTGTLTQNKLTVGELFSFKDVSCEDILLYASLACNQDQPDAIDKAILDTYKNTKKLSEYYKQSFVPFDPINKKTESNIKHDNKTFKVAKGAPQVIIELAKLTETEKNTLNKQIEEFAQKGFRTLGVAKSDDNQSWQFLGLIPLFDPPREDTKQTIETAFSMGISIKMITGDHLSIAKETALKVGLGKNIVPIKDVLSQSENLQKFASCDGFSEVYPEHKFEIVKKFQEAKNIVGMTGDGVNDAPALKQADIGIAVSGATDAARASADLILTMPGLMVITKAIEEARKIFGRLKSYAIYRVSETCRLLFFLLFSILVYNQKPLSAIMIILIALLNDIPIMTIAHDHMTISPEPTKWSMKEVFTIAIGLSVIGVVSTFGLYWIGLTIWQLPIEQCSTLAFMGILCGGNLTIYLTRNQNNVFSKPLPEMKFFLATLFSQIIGTVVSVYGLWSSDFVGIGWKYVGYAWVYIAVWFFVCWLTKIVLYKILNMNFMSKDFLQKTQSSIHSHTK